MAQVIATSLNAANATGNGSTITVPIGLEESNNVGVWLTYTGTPTTTSVTLQASPDNGANWFTVGSALTGNTAQAATYTIPPGSYQVRLNLGTLSGGTAPTVTGLIGFNKERGA